MTSHRNRIHPAVLKAQQQLEQGRISRREFLRFATLLGVSASSAYALAACAGQPQPVASAPATSSAPVAGPTKAEATAAPTSAIKRGGTLRQSTEVMAVDHPARFSWTQAGNMFTHAFPRLTVTDSHNITHPYLLEKWEASPDVTEWTLYLRRGIKWTNGDEFVADDVVFNFLEWLNPDVGSSMLGLFQGFLTKDGIEVVDKYTVKLHLDSPKIDIPENLYHYPSPIMHHNFDGNIASGKNPSIGPFIIDSYIVGERMRLVRREDFWLPGVDGKPLPYLDAIEYIDLGSDQTAAVAALLAGQIDKIYEPYPETMLAVRDNPKVRVDAIDSSDTRVLRMRADMDPWKDNRVRLALKKCQRRQEILDKAYFGEGVLGHDAHVAPSHPEYAKMDIPEYDPEGAKQLLAEAGYPNGLDVSIAVGSGWTDIVAYAEVLREDAKAGGFNITINSMPTSAYWDIWTKTNLGITSWGHRPLAVMTLALAYTADPNGEPVAWNETHWLDDEFISLLQDAQGTLDVEARRTIMAKLEKIQIDRGSIGISYWMNQWIVHNPAFQNLHAHPMRGENWNEVWYDPDQDPFKKS